MVVSQQVDIDWQFRIRKSGYQEDRIKQRGFSAIVLSKEKIQLLKSLNF